jgi:hypothetical protein
MHLSAALPHYLVCFHTQARFDCRMADRVLRDVPPTGSLAICPAGIDCAADVEGSVDLILIAIDPDRFSLAAAQDAFCARVRQAWQRSRLAPALPIRAICRAGPRESMASRSASLRHRDSRNFQDGKNSSSQIACTASQPFTGRNRRFT